ncbi:Fic Protein involved in cell division [Fimbriimonadaceae bacterium]
MLMTSRYGETEIDHDELQGLIPSLATRAELDEFEQANIREAMLWARKSRAVRKSLLAPATLCELHDRMFRRVWTWAGKFRKTEKNIGVPVWKISSDLFNACEDAKTWIEFNTFEPIEIAARLHHRLVVIHPFPNGNGRWARFAADLVLEQISEEQLSWGANGRMASEEIRKSYIQALRQADVLDFQPLISFVVA